MGTQNILNMKMLHRLWKIHSDLGNLYKISLNENHEKIVFIVPLEMDIMQLQVQTITSANIPMS